MFEFLLGLVVFFSIHSVSIVALPFRDRMVERYPRGWRVAHGSISIVGLVLIAWGYAEYRLVAPVFYFAPLWLHHLLPLLLLPVFILLLAPVFPSRINTLLPYPHFIAVKLWAAAHLLVNGSAADLLLFGAFLVWAVAGRIAARRRPKRAMIRAFQSPANIFIVTGTGLALYALFVFWLHEALIGMPPLKF